MPASFYRVGDYRAGESSTVTLPRDWRKDGTRAAVILARGYGDDLMTGYDPARGQLLLQALTDAGYGCFYGDLGGNSWGSDTALAGLTSAVSYMQGAIGAKAGKVALVGFSMGGLNVMAWAAANKASVSCVALCCPVSDLNNIYANASYTASINSAYGGAYSDATYGAAHNPKLLAAAGAYSGLPVKAWYSSNDPIIPVSTVTANMTAIGATASSVNAGTQGHSWQVQATRTSEIVAFIQANHPSS